MEEKLQEILNQHSENIEMYKKRNEKLTISIEFFKEHDFKEEERIARLKLNTIDMMLYRYEMLHSEIQDVLNKWQS